MKEYRKDILTMKDIAYMMDPSVLKLDTTLEDVKDMVELCKKYGCGTCFCWPCYYPQLVELLKGTDTAFGTSLAFPSGQEATETKVQLAEYFMTMNPAENDMVMNVGYLKSGRYDLVLEDIKAVRKATEGDSEGLRAVHRRRSRLCEIGYGIFCRKTDHPPSCKGDEGRGGRPGKD